MATSDVFDQYILVTCDTNHRSLKTFYSTFVTVYNITATNSFPSLHVPVGQNTMFLVLENKI